MPATVSAPQRTLMVFVKHPRPGAVKTRLVPLLGAEDAAELYRALAESVLAATLPRRLEYERLVFYDPPEAGQAMRAWLPSGRLRRQQGGDLGARMAFAFARAFARGASRAAIVGSDVVGLSREAVLSAFEALDGADVVLGPSHDGGYYLVALKQAQPLLFEDVAWSTPAVMEDTLRRAASGGLSVRRLDTRHDLDTAEDLGAQWSAVRPLLEGRPALRARIETRIAEMQGRTR